MSDNKVAGWTNWETSEVINWINTDGVDERYQGYSDAQALADAMSNDHLDTAQAVLSGALLSFALEGINSVNWLEIATHIVTNGEGDV